METPTNDTVVRSILVFLSLFLHRSLSKNIYENFERAESPPRGWNSYDSFSWTISEEEFFDHAEIVSQQLRGFGFMYVVVDYLWYRKKVQGAYADSLGFDTIDEWGRMVPDTQRWPSSKDGKGFSEVSKRVHKMGLKFGIHVMRGISTQAVNANTPILDTTTASAYEESGKQWRAKDIALTNKACAWMPHGFMSVNTTLPAGRAFLRSLYIQYASWGVDYVKHDCVFGDDLDLNEIAFVSEVLRELNRPILYSLSPGTNVTPAMAKHVSGLVNMYRITGDDWDRWPDVASHFDITRDLANFSLIGAKGLLGRSWPDLDMLPLGWLTDPGSNEGPHRQCKLNLEEQKTQVTLWAIAKSPLMLGGDLRRLDATTFNLVTNPTILEINSFSSSNMEMWELNVNGTLATSYSRLCATVNTVRANVLSIRIRSWAAIGRRGEIYVAFFNLNQEKIAISAKISDLANVLDGRFLKNVSCKAREVWSGTRFVVTERLAIDVEAHGCALFVLNCIYY